jgi:hypothetical protein
MQGTKSTRSNLKHHLPIANLSIESQRLNKQKGLN